MYQRLRSGGPQTLIPQALQLATAQMCADFEKRQFEQAFVCAPLYFGMAWLPRRQLAIRIAGLKAHNRSFFRK